MGENIDRVKQRLDLAIDKRRRLALSPGKPLGLDLPGRIHGKHAFLGEPGKHPPDRGHVLLDRGRRGLALQRFDVGRDRNRLDVLDVLISGPLAPGQKLVDGSIVSGPGVCVSDRDGKKLEELFPGFWPSARDEGWSCERISKDGKFGVRHLPKKTTLKGPLLASHKRGYVRYS